MSAQSTTISRRTDRRIPKLRVALIVVLGVFAVAVGFLFLPTAPLDQDAVLSDYLLIQAAAVATIVLGIITAIRSRRDRWFGIIAGSIMLTAEVVIHVIAINTVP